jgi:alkanesulfonate monooxygenase SsuD/methylene tetrahydromethanopterin reductase-like flavin-dependent oxidoreductase (luciferase family)
LGAGWNKPEYDAFGIPFDHRVDRFEEAAQIIRPLLKEGRVDFDGVYYRASDCEIAPFGPRKPGPPLMFGSFGPRMMKLTAQYADMWNTAYFGEPVKLKEPLENLESACAEVGRDFDSLEKTVLIALAYPDLAEPPPFMDTFLTGSTEKLVQAFKGYEELGVSQLMFHCSPYNTESMGRLVEAIKAFRAL